MFDRLAIEFAYESGDHTQIGKAHQEAFRSAEGYDVTAVRAKGIRVVLKADAHRDVHDLHPFIDDEDKLRYERGQATIDLRDYPLIFYSLGSETSLSSEDTSRAGDDPLLELVEMVKIGYAATDEPPVLVYSSTPDMPSIGRPPFTAQSLADDELTHLCWLTIFTPRFVETYGRETLLSAPAWHVEELDDGSILVVCHDDPSWRSSIQSVADHIGLPSYDDFW